MFKNSHMAAETTAAVPNYNYANAKIDYAGT
jgi:hypothetical protein